MPSPDYSPLAGKAKLIVQRQIRPLAALACTLLLAFRRVAVACGSFPAEPGIGSLVVAAASAVRPHPQVWPRAHAQFFKDLFQKLVLILYYIF